MVDKLTMQEYAELPDIILDNSKMLNIFNC